MNISIRGAVLERLDAETPYSRSKPITVSELTLEAPKDREVLVKIEAVSLCHSDLSVVDGVRPRPVPMLLGHEAAGRVIERGSLATQFKVGQRVIMTFLPRCGECAACLTDGRLPCTAGSASNEAGTLMGGGKRLLRDQEEVYHHLGVSGFATHAVVDERSLVAVGEDVPSDVAAVLGCAVLTGGGAVLNAPNVPPKSSAVVIGLGGVGMAAVMVAKALGHRVVGVDAVEAKRQLALEVGAEAALDPSEFSEQQITAPLVVDATGNARGFESAVRATAPGGTTVTVGLPAPDALAQISPLALVSGARTIVGSYLGSAVPRRDIPIFIDLWRQGKLPLEKLITSHISLGDINAGMDALANGTAIRQVISFGDSQEEQS